MFFTDAITQPRDRTNLQALESIAQAGRFNQLNVAAAYVTIGGARDLIHSLRLSMGDLWDAIDKRWVFAFDYCRSEPLALQMFLSEPRSAVRIHNGSQILATKCLPRTPFHPKTFIFRGENRLALFAGSGNISRSGLNTGHEVGLLLATENPANASERQIHGQIQRVAQWHDTIWAAADPLTPQLLQAYREIFDSVENRQRPTPTEDDTAAASVTQGLTSDQLVKLRVCSHFWIEAGNITRNLGRHAPGNQLMMKKLSRVFFGVPAANVPHNSPLSTVAITYNGATKRDCSLTFSDNSMDKLTLPLPGNGGPAAYDQETLIFKRIGSASFELELASPSRKRACLRNSRAISAIYSMSSSGRQWGVY